MLLPLEYVAEEGMHESAAHAADMRRVMTSSHKKLAANEGTQGLKGATSSSSDESEVDDDPLRTFGHGDMDQFKPQHLGDGKNVGNGKVLQLHKHH